MHSLFRRSQHPSSLARGLWLIKLEVCFAETSLTWYMVGNEQLGIPGLCNPSLCREAEIKPSCSYFSHWSFVTVDKSFKPHSAHIPTDNRAQVPGGKVKLKGFTLHGLSSFKSFYKPGCRSGHLKPNFPLIFLTPCCCCPSKASCRDPLFTQWLCLAPQVSHAEGLCTS